MTFEIKHRRDKDSYDVEDDFTESYKFINWLQTYIGQNIKALTSPAPKHNDPYLHEDTIIFQFMPVAFSSRLYGEVEHIITIQFAPYPKENVKNYLGGVYIKYNVIEAEIVDVYIYNEAPIPLRNEHVTLERPTVFPTLHDDRPVWVVEK